MNTTGKRQHEIPSGYLSLDMIARRTGRSISQLRKHLLQLWSEQGVAVQRGGRWYVNPIVIPAIRKDRTEAD